VPEPARADIQQRCARASIRALASDDLHRREKGMIEFPGTRRRSHRDPKLELWGSNMANKKSSSGVYRVTEIIGTSAVSWEEAAKSAVATASKTLRDLRVAEIVKLDLKVENGKIVAYRARVALSFKYEA
jgi:flavin-binding protein dodecin